MFASDTVFDNVLIGLHRQGTVDACWDTLLALPREQAAEADACASNAHEILRFVGLERRADDLAGSLSYGEQRLVGVALALAAQPSMLLLDEPVSGMNAGRPRQLHAS